MVLVASFAFSNSIRASGRPWDRFPCWLLLGECKHRGRVTDQADRRFDARLPACASRRPGRYQLASPPLHFGVVSVTGDCQNDIMISIGVNVKSQDIYMAAVTPPSLDGRAADAVHGASGRVTPSTNLKGAAQLLDLKVRVQADLREWGASHVSLLGTGKHANWVYSHAQNRILSISAIMYACAEENIEFSVVKPGDAGRAVLSPKLDNIDLELFGLDAKPTYWTTGLSDAFAAAAVKVGRLGQGSKGSEN